MKVFASSLIFTTICLYQALAFPSSCEKVTNPSGRGIVTFTYPGPKGSSYEKCWTILNPRNQLMEIELKQLNLEKRSCSYVFLNITANRKGENVRWCDDDKRKNPMHVYSDVTVHFYASYGELIPNSRNNFQVHYKIDDGIKGIEGVNEAYRQGVRWLKYNSTSSKTMDNIPKAVTALAVSEGAKFDGGNLEEELMAKKRDLRISITLLRDAISNELLSTFINSLLSTCNNPRNFYGYNVVELLKSQMAAETFSHPSSYLALCNANETWPERAHQDLLKTLNSLSSMPFNRDLQAFGVMAFSCKLLRGGNDFIYNGEKLLAAYYKNLQDFRRLQNPTGSFGNVQRTALIAQALLSSVAVNESSVDWDDLKAIQFLMKSMKVSEFLSTYLILPLLNEKTLVDIAFTNCSAFRDKDTLVDEVHDYVGPKMQVQYSLFVGDSKDVIHTIGVKVPKFFTAFDVMKFAALKDKKYEFKYELVFGKLDIYEMVDTPNDSEEGKFWLFYMKESTPGNTFVKVSEETGPAKTALSEGDHIAMWYRRYPM